jgi:hypothetical protein
MRDFFAFRKMITPVVIQILFWVGVLGCILAGIITMFSGGVALLMGNDILAGVLPVLLGLFWIFIGPIIVRIYCEILILFFRMNDTLIDIKHNTEHKAV